MNDGSSGEVAGKMQVGECIMLLENQLDLSETLMAFSETAMDSFLASVERRAFRMARVAVAGNNEDALDIVQDAMFSFVRRYAGKPEKEWAPLFHRVLQNTIRDWFRRQKIRNRWRGWVSNFSGRGEEEKEDPMARVVDNGNPGPETAAEHQDAMTALEGAFQKLPLRQQQAFLLRMWEGLSIVETAEAMKCSAGSVKSHYSRAVSFLRKELEGHWP